MIKPPSEQHPRRTPAAFAFEDDAPRSTTTTETQPQSRKPASFSGEVVLTSDEDDPFLNPDKDIPPSRSPCPASAGRPSPRSRSAPSACCFRSPSGCGPTA
jgi:putative membrane protein